MLKEIFLATVLFLTLSIYGTGKEFFTVNLRNDGTVEIEVNDKVEDYSYAELFRAERNNAFVPIFEFTTGISTFNERFSPDTCYRTKVYFLSGSSVVTDVQCVRKIDYFAYVDIGFLLIFSLFSIAFLLPLFYHPEFISCHDNDATKIFRTVKGLLREESRDVSFLQNDYSFGNPMKESFKSLITLFSFYCDTENDVNYNLHYFEKYSGSDGNPDMTGFNENSITIPILPASMSGVELEKKLPALLLSCNSGSIESDYVSYQTPDRAMMINLSNTTTGIVSGVLSGGKTLLSLESFTLPSEMESIRSEKKVSYGPYFFIAIVSIVIFTGSVLYTVNSFFPLLTVLQNFMEGGS